MNNSCTNSKYMPLAVNVGLHVVILFTILSFFFVFYISKVSREVINGEIKNNLHDLLEKSDEYVAPVRQYLDLGTLTKLKTHFLKPDKTVEETNSWLVSTIFLTNAALALLIISVIMIMTYSCGYCIPLKHIVIENILVFAGIGVVEFLFFTKVALKYVPAPPSAIIKSFFKSVEKNLQ